MPDPSLQSSGGGAEPPWYAMSAEEVAERLDVPAEQGLSSAEAAARLTRYGRNVLEEEKVKPAWLRFLEQYKSYMQIVLIIAAIVSLFIAEYRTFLLLIVLTIFIAVLGYKQEAKAAASVAALNRMMKIVAKVRRDGGIVQVEADQIVPGDIVIVDAGDRIPADGRVIVAANLQIEEAALTGESTAVEKSTRRHRDTGPVPRRPREHGLHEHERDPGPRRDPGHRDRHAFGGGSYRDHAQGAEGGEDSAHPADRPGHALHHRDGGAGLPQHRRDRARPG